jgi:hypothetical protein
MLRRDITALGDPTRAAASSLDAQSRTLQQHVAETKEFERRSRRRQVRVLRRFAEASRAAYASEYDAERRAASAQRMRDARAHQRILDEREELREKRVFVAREVEKIVAEDFKAAVSAVKQERSDIYATEMFEWTEQVRRLRELEDAKRVRVAEQHQQAASTDERRSVLRQQEVEQNRVAAAEAGTRDALVASEISEFHQLYRDFEHQERATQVMHNKRERVRYKRSLAALRAAEANLKQFFDKEIRTRAAIGRAELADRQSLRSRFIDAYKDLVEMARRHHAQRLDESRRDRQRRLEEDEARRRAENSRSRQAASQRRQRDMQHSRASAAESALEDRESRMLAVRDARANAVADIQARRAKTLMLLRGEKAPSETPAFRVAAGVSHVREPLSPELRDEVIRMIREH